MQVEGRNPVLEALARRRRRVHRVLLDAGAKPEPRLRRIVQLAGEAGIVVDRVPRARLDQLCDGRVHQGVVAHADDPPTFATTKALVEDCFERGEVPFVVLVDTLSYEHNLGAILRSAEVFGARAVIAPSRYSAPETGALAKTASGALERQPYVRVRNLADAMGELREMGYVLLGLAGEAEDEIETRLADLKDVPVGLVLGAEGPGLRERTRETCDHLVKIPFAAEFGSLNVSNASAVALFAATRT